MLISQKCLSAYRWYRLSEGSFGKMGKNEQSRHPIVKREVRSNGVKSVLDVEEVE